MSQTILYCPFDQLPSALASPSKLSSLCQAICQTNRGEIFTEPSVTLSVTEIIKTMNKPARRSQKRRCRDCKRPSDGSRSRVTFTLMLCFMCKLLGIKGLGKTTGYGDVTRAGGGLGVGHDHIIALLNGSDMGQLRLTL